MNQFSAKAFQRKIDAFCQLRLAPLFNDDELPRLKWVFAHAHSDEETGAKDTPAAPFRNGSTTTILLHNAHLSMLLKGISFPDLDAILRGAGGSAGRDRGSDVLVRS